MSNLIPMVSASPPPLDEKEFEWGDEEEDFGTFTSADNSVSDMNWSNMKHDYISDETLKNESDSCESSQQENTNAEMKSVNESKTHIVSKPQVQKLPLLTDNHITENSHSSPDDKDTISPNKNTDACKEQTVVPGSLKRDSDSGMFSTDISPVPVSEEGTIELDDCDKTVDSVEEETDMIPDLPSDTDKSSIETCDNKNNDDHSSDNNLCPDKLSSDHTCNSNAADNDQKLCSSKKGNNVDKTFEILPDSDEEFDQVSSNVLHSLSQPTPHSTDLNNQSAPAGALNVEGISETGTNGNISNSVDPPLDEDDDFGDFADFSNQETNWGCSDDKPAITEDATETETSTIKEAEVPNNSISNSKENINTSLPIEENGAAAVSQADRPLDLNVVDPHENAESPASPVVSETDKNNCRVTEDVESEETSCSNDENLSDVVNNNESEEIDDFADFSKFDTSLETESKKDNTNDTSNIVGSSVTTDSSDELIEKTNGDDFTDFSTVGENVINHNDNHGSKISADAETLTDDKANNGDDDDDFADFSSVTISGQLESEPLSHDKLADSVLGTPTSKQSSSIDSSSIDNQNNVDDDDFADFSSVTLPTNSSKVNDNSPGYGQNDDDDFADFSSVKPVSNDVSPPDGEDDEWGAFDEAEEFRSDNKPSTNNTTQSKVIDIEKLRTVLGSCFNTNNVVTSDAEKNVSLLESLLVGPIYHQTNDINNREESLKKVMKQVFDYDNTNALIYQWKKSHSNDRLFKTLKIDTQNMFFGLKKEVVPLSLTNLTLLEPIRGSVPGKKDKNLEALVEPNTDSLPQLQDMPPVEFDWDNSGLTNPLEAKTLDLDFMVMQENENNMKTGVFQSELLDAPRSSVKPMQPLEDILKTMKLTTTAAPTSNKKDENLSKEADSIIDSLPLLSFMKSKVLMFRLQNS